MNLSERLKVFVQSRSHRFLRALGVIGVLIGWATMYFFENWDGPLFWLLICVATIFSATGAWGGLAEQWGYKPLTNDPLGWRAAKKTYEHAPSPEDCDSEEQ
jgi:hypothetical protein